MTFQRASRGQAMQMGAIILFAFLVLAASAFQAFAVPGQNSEVEFDAYQEASANMIELDGALLRAGSGVSSSTTVRSGARYPSRMLFANPGPPSGSIRTTPAAPVVFSNVNATAPDANDYWGQGNESFETRSVVFQPGYNLIDVPAVVATGEFAYRRPETGAFPVTGQTLVRGNHIRLVTLTGNVDTAGYATSVTATPVSAATRTVQVTNASGGPLVLTVPTDLSAETWEQKILAAQIADGNVTAVTPNGSDAVDIELEPGAYEMELARVQVSQSTPGDDVPATAAHYVVRAAANHSIALGHTTQLTAEVRDRFNNPKSGVAVTFTTPDGRTRTVTSDEEGRVTFPYAPSSSGTKTVEASFNGSEAPLNETAFTVQVASAGEGTNLNPGSGLALREAVIVNDNEVDVRFENLDGRNITHARIGTYVKESPGKSRTDPARAVTNFTDDPLVIGETFVSVNDSKVASVSDLWLNFMFQKQNADGTFEEFPVKNDDFYTFSVVFESGDTVTYIIAPED